MRGAKYAFRSGVNVFECIKRLAARLAAFAYRLATLLLDVKRHEEARSLLRKTLHVARRVLGENHADTLRLRWNYADALYNDPGATLDDLREAVTTLEDAERIARRVLGGAYPMTTGIAQDLRAARAALRARKTLPPAGGLAEEVD